MRSYGAPMNAWPKRGTTIALVLALSGPALAGCGEDRPPLSAEECRAAWGNLRQTQGENGPLAPPGTATRSRWHEEQEAATQKEKQPGDLGSCSADVAAAGQRFERLIELAVAIQAYDLAAQLVFAEGDLEHARELGGFAELPPRLDRAFDDLRRAAPQVHEAVAPVEAKAADVDLDDRGDVEDLVAEIEDAATSHPSYAKGRKALDVIGRYELHEE